MADDDQRAGDGPGSISDFIAQLRGVTEQMVRLTGLQGTGSAASRALPSLPNLPELPPLPGALSSAQLSAISRSVAAQRSSIEALRTQLEAFDEQLAVLERIIDPLTEWSRTWAELEGRLTRIRREADG